MEEQAHYSIVLPGVSHGPKGSTRSDKGWTRYLDRLVPTCVLSPVDFPGGLSLQWLRMHQQIMPMPGPIEEEKERKKEKRRETQSQRLDDNQG